MDWDKLRIFHAAAEAGSFTHAGEHLRMSQSAVSRQVSALERELNVPLFHRHARGLVLTEQGELLFNTAREVMNKLHTAETLLGDAKTKPAGELRITCPVGFGTVWVTQRMREFMDLYPDIRVELILNDDQVDIAMRAADAAIWTREPEQADLIRRKLFQMQVRAYASAQYVRLYGAPQSLADLDTGNHRFVSHSGIPAYHLSLIQSLETLGREGLEPRVPAFQDQFRDGDEVCDPFRAGGGLAARLPDGGGKGFAACPRRGRDAKPSDYLRLSGRAQGLEEGSSLARLPRCAGAQLETLMIRNPR